MDVSPYETEPWEASLSPGKFTDCYWWQFGWKAGHFYFSIVDGDKTLGEGSTPDAALRAAGLLE